MIAAIAALALLAGQSSDTMTPVEAYRTFYVGTYAVAGQCADVQRTYVFMERAIVHGALYCEVNDVIDDEGAIMLTTRGCTLESKAVAPVTYRLDLFSTDVVEVREGDNRAKVRRCYSY